MFSINPVSGVPIYRQIVDQVRRAVQRGNLAEGDTLPSVRALSGELGINPMTVSKAYGLLESEGLVNRRRGVGMQVAASVSPASEDPLAPLNLLEIIAHAKQLGIDKAEVITAIEKMWEERT